MKTNVKIAVTQGDPAGIGPELAVRCAHHFADRAEVTLFGSPSILKEANMRFGKGAPICVCATDDLPFDARLVGHDSAVCGRSALRAIESATQSVLAGTHNAIVTAPASKHAVNLAGIPFQGHTEFIAKLCNTEKFAMMQSDTHGLRVAFVTTHIPVSKISESLTCERICDVIRMLDVTIRSENIKCPKIAVCALNPHAGENGDMGDEESRLIRPAIECARALGICVDGPMVPDIIFMESQRTKYDGIVSMYHDQGHIPFKMLAFECGVNSTLGLPMIRTSPDHGVAYDIAWQGKAHTGSMFAAMETAIRRAQKVTL